MEKAQRSIKTFGNDKNMSLAHMKVLFRCILLVVVIFHRISLEVLDLYKFKLDI